VAPIVLHDPVAFRPPKGVFNAASAGGHTTIRRVLRGREFSSKRLLLGLDARDVMPAEALAALILRQLAARWQGLPRPLCHALI
jgi:hypothetical protein